VLLNGAPLGTLLGELAATGVFAVAALGLAMATSRKRLG
jgi:hypothetical protein